MIKKFLLALSLCAPAAAPAAAPISAASAAATLPLAAPVGAIAASYRRARPAAGAVVYDTSVGLGVDSAGFANLPLRSGASRYFVNATTGSDANSCTAAKTASTPKATLTSAKGCVVDGNGDQVLVAEGTTYGESLNQFFTHEAGFSPAYPTVLQSYDPADALNEAKYGRASGSNRPKLTTTSLLQWFAGTSAPQVTAQYVVIRGMDFDNGGAADMKMDFNSTYTPASYILLENNLFHSWYISKNDSASNAAQHFIVRNSSIAGPWSIVTGARVQGLYTGELYYPTIEDCVIYHVGWKIGANKEDPVGSGGTDQAGFDHPWYLQNDNHNFTYRRNLIIDGPLDGGHLLVEGLAKDNVVIDAPLGLGLGGGPGFWTNKPSGVIIEAAYNLIMGGMDTNTSTLNHASNGIWNSGTVAGSSVHHNLIINSWESPLTASGGSAALRSWTETGALVASTMNWHDNVVYKRSASGGTRNEQDQTGTLGIFNTYTNNIWDDPTSGTNKYWGDVTFPHAYGNLELLNAAGYAGADWATAKQALANYATANPEQHPGRAILNLAMAGYGINHSVGGSTNRLNLAFTTGSYSVSGVSYGSLAAIPGFSYTRSGSLSVLDSDGGVDTFTANTVPINGYGLHNYAALTNLLKASADFTSASWAKSNVTVTADTAVAPDGTTTADTLDFSVSGIFNVRQSPGTTAAQPYTLAFFAKRGTATDLNYRIIGTDGATTIVQGSYYSQTNSSTFSRIVVPFTGDGANATIRPLNGSNSPMGTAFLWGAQVLNANLPDGGPYVPTTTATVTTGAATFSYSFPNGTYDVVYTFDDNSTQTISTTVSAGTMTLATAPTLNRGRIKSVVIQWWMPLFLAGRRRRRKAANDNEELKLAA